MSISKTYSPQDIEGKWYDYWMEHDLFRSVPDEREPYVVVIHPPNVTGILHMGHMLNNTIQDVLIRRHRMMGRNACWVPGTDHASIATEAKVVKMLKDQGIDKADLSREEFLKHAFEWKDKYGGIILKQLRKLGASCDWERTDFTMNDHYYEAVIKVFCDLHEKGHIYRGYRMVNWDPAGLTAVSDEEVIHRDSQGKFYYVRYRIEGTEDEYITVATTRPETILGDTAIAVHPEDERYTHLLGKKAIVPLVGRAIPIIADDYIDRELGTGCLKVTPAHDINDYEIGLRHKLPVIDVFNPDGTMSEAAGLYIGQDRFVVRKQIAKDLKASGDLLKTEDIVHSIGYSERTDAVIEPRMSEQWFLNMEQLSQPAFKAVMDDTVKLIPAKFKNTYRHWMENIRDWCISRQLWWGQRIPAYYLPDGSYVVAPTAEAALEKARAQSGNPDMQPADLRQDPDVLDTWFSSWIWPIEVFRGLTDPGNEELKYYYPTHDLVTAPEILFFWVARMIIAGYEYEGERPFNNVYLTGIVRDKQRRKMSKSLGNSPDPLELIAEYGADAIRVGMLLASPAGNDLLFDMSLVEQGGKFCNKIWQAHRLVILSFEGEDRPMNETEALGLEWITQRFIEARTELDRLYDEFRMSEALMAVYKLVWDDFCSSFLEMMKPSADGKVSEDALLQIKEKFSELMQIAHPFVPFISEDVWQRMGDRKAGESICVTPLKPLEGSADESVLAPMRTIQDTVTAIRALKSEKGIGKYEEIEMVIKTKDASAFEKGRSILEKFLQATDIRFEDSAPAGAAGTRVGNHEIFVPLGDSVDLDAEIDKLKKDLEYQEGFLNSVMRKLGNEKFVSGAPEAVVANERKKQADAEARIAMLKDSLASLEAAKA